jgi:hypothetical protein
LPLSRRGKSAKTRHASVGRTRLGGKLPPPSLAMAMLLAPGAVCPRSQHKLAGTRLTARPALPLRQLRHLRLHCRPCPARLSAFPLAFSMAIDYTAPAACASPHSGFAPKPAHKLCLWTSSAARRGEGSRTEPALAGLSKLGGKERPPSLAMARLAGTRCLFALAHYDRLAGTGSPHGILYGDSPYATAPLRPQRGPPVRHCPGPGHPMVHIRGSGVPRSGRPGCPGAIPDSGVGLPRSARTCPGICAHWRSLAPVGPDCPGSLSCAIAFQTAQTAPYATAPGCPAFCWALAGQCGALWRQPPSRENDYVQNRSCRSQPPEYIHEGSRAAEWASKRGAVLRLTAGRLGHYWALRNRRPGPGCGGAPFMWGQLLRWLLFTCTSA